MNNEWIDKLNEIDFENEISKINDEIASFTEKKNEIDDFIDGLNRSKHDLIKKRVNEIGNAVIGKTYRDTFAGTFLIVKEVMDDFSFKCLSIGLPERFVFKQLANDYVCLEEEILGTRMIKNKQYVEIPREEFDRVSDAFINGSGLKGIPLNKQ